MNRQVDTIEDGVGDFIKKCTNGRGKITDWKYDEIGRYCAIVEDDEPTRLCTKIHKKYFVLYKRHYEYRFGINYNKPEMHGMNVTPSLMVEAYLQDAIIVCVMNDGMIFSCTAKKWKEYVDENNTIGSNFDHTKGKDFIEASIPKSLMKQIF